MKKTHLLFLTILLEGYVVLACELLAVRQLIPFVGSGTEIIAIIISGVLLPLAVGYNAGGNAFKRLYRKQRLRGKQALSIRTALIHNMITAIAILGVGLSYPFMELFFDTITLLGITHRLAQAALYVLIFLVTPVFLLGQTVPLVSNYFSRQRLSEITGRMLFFSTAGSFLGSVFSTIVLMTTIGVHFTVVITLGLLGLLCVLLSMKKITAEHIICVVLLATIYSVNNEQTMKYFHIVSDNAYNMVNVFENKKTNVAVLSVNRSASSMISRNGEKLNTYVQYIEDNFIMPFAQPGDTPMEILVVGSGGFTVGLADTVNHYTFVDIDPALKNVAQTHFLLQDLSPNKQFAVASARAFVHSASKQYDLIILDTYTNQLAIPAETTTREYLQEVKKLLKPEAILVANIIASPNFADAFSVRYDNTFSGVFPKHSRQWVGATNPLKTEGHNRKEWRPANMLYIYYNNALMSDDTIYTDDKNTYSLDVK